MLELLNSFNFGFSFIDSVIRYWTTSVLYFSVHRTTIVFYCINVLTMQTNSGASSRGFATRLGRGLEIGALSQSSRSDGNSDATQCPPVLELRQLLQYQPVSEQTRARLGHNPPSFIFRPLCLH